MAATTDTLHALESSEETVKVLREQLALANKAIDRLTEQLTADVSWMRLKVVRRDATIRALKRAAKKAEALNKPAAGG